MNGTKSIYELFSPATLVFINDETGYFCDHEFVKGRLFNEDEFNEFHERYPGKIIVMKRVGPEYVPPEDLRQ